MIRLYSEADKLLLEFNGHRVFCHSTEQPFISALKLDVEYSGKSGIFRPKKKVEERIDLVKYMIIEDMPNQKSIIFLNGEARINLYMRVNDDLLTIDMDATPGFGYLFNFTAYRDEGIFGGGEQYRKLNLKGEKVINLVSEHIKFKAILAKTVFAFLPHKLSEHKDIGSYCPMTTFTSSKLYAMRFYCDGYGEMDFSRPDVSSFLFFECPQSISIYRQKSFAALSQRMARDIPNNQFLPDWAYDGMILGVQGGIDTVTEKAIAMKKAGAKICGVWCQDWSGQKVTAVGKQVYWNWSADIQRYADLSQRIVQLKKEGIHFLAYINPYLIKDGVLYNYAKDKNYLIKNKKGDIYHIKSTTFDAGMLDLTNPDAVTYIKDVLIKQNMLSLGIDGYMADFGEYLPLDCLLHDGDAAELHNRWPLIWAKINREAVKESGREEEIFFFTRSGYNGVQQYTTMMWNGDQHTDWSVDYGLPTVMPASFSLGFSGVTSCHCDVGGFFSFKSLKRNEELFTRWLEMCTFSPLMRSHESIRPDFNAQYDAELVKPYAVKLTNAHAALKPYLLKLMSDANAGLPSIRPDFYNNSDFSTHADQYSYFLGEDIFVAPVITEGATKRRVTLPEGQWVRFFVGEEYTHGTHTVDVPLGCPAAFYRKDSQFADIFAAIR